MHKVDIRADIPVDVWVVDVHEPTIVREVLRYSKEKLRSEPELKHIKRVCRRRNAEGVQEGEPNSKSKRFRD